MKCTYSWGVPKRLSQQTASEDEVHNSILNSIQLVQQNGHQMSHTPDHEISHETVPYVTTFQYMVFSQQYKEQLEVQRAAGSNAG